MGCHAASSGLGRRPAGTARLAKKALSIRPRLDRQTDARPAPGAVAQGQRGAARAAADGRVDWLRTLSGGRPRRRADVCWQQRQAREPLLWLIIVDTSASVRRHAALSDAKGLLAQLFDQAYRQRARLALLTTSGERPSWQRHGLKASRSLQPWLDQLGAGGGTPLLAGLQQAAAWLHKRRRGPVLEQQRCVLVTDGRVKNGAVSVDLGCPTLLIDIERGAIRLQRSRQIAAALGAEYRHIDTLPVRR